MMGVPYENYDLGRVLQTAESIKNMRRNAEADKLQQAYMAQRTQNDKAQENRTQTAFEDEQGVAHAKRVYLVSQAVVGSDDPVGTVRQFAPDLIKEIDQHYGPGSFDQLAQDPVKLKAIIGQTGQMAGAHAGISSNGTPEQQFAASQQMKMAGVNHTNELEEIKARGVEDRRGAKEKAAVSFDPSSVENTAQMIASNQMPILSGYALRTPWGQAVVSRVREINPEFSGQNYGSQSAGLKQFTSGKNGNTIRSLNVAVQHLDQLGQLATALGNNDLQAVNKIGNYFAQQTGSPAPTNFNTAKKIVADEIVKAIVGSGGGVSDREEAAATINAANSPAQLNQAIETYQGLLTGQLNGIRQQYQTSTGRNDFESLLLPETKARLESHSQQQSQQPQQRPLSPQEAMQLPPGTPFIGLDGQPRVRH